MNHITIDYSAGRGKSGQRYAYVRPALPCRNRSRRFRLDKLQAGIEKHFPQVLYFDICGTVIGAKDEASALKEYWRICPIEEIGKAQKVNHLKTCNQ
jgi:hypothetical protein